jgi:hypothetical protein
MWCALVGGRVDAADRWRGGVRGVGASWLGRLRCFSERIADMAKVWVGRTEGNGFRRARG